MAWEKAVQCSKNNGQPAASNTVALEIYSKPDFNLQAAVSTYEGGDLAFKNSNPLPQVSWLASYCWQRYPSLELTALLSIENNSAQTRY